MTSTVSDLFINATNQFGLPSKVPTDRGVENPFCWGRGRLFKTLPVTRDTFSMGLAFPKEIRFFLIASFTNLIGNLSSRVISTFKFHMVFRAKLAVVLILLLRPELDFT